MTEVDFEGVARGICSSRGLVFCGKTGEGAFKVTFRVSDSEGGHLALKIFKSMSIGDRAEREIEAMPRCSHPNVGRLVAVDILPWGSVHRLYVLEEFLSGGTLSARIESRGFSRSEWKEMGLQLIDGLAYIAGLGLVHRDIKPDNIMFRGDDCSPVIVDLGVVKDLYARSLTPTWAPHGPGTPLFSSPEQLNNDKRLLDWRSDQFSLGLVLSNVYYNVHPYLYEDSGADAVSLMMQRRHPGILFRERVLQDGLPPILRMLGPWPHQRYRTPGELALSWSKI